MCWAGKLPIAAGAALALSVAAANAAGDPFLVLAQANAPPPGMTEATKPTTLESRYKARFPQPARVGDVVGLPVLDLNASTLGYVREIVRRADGKITLIVDYSRLWGWFGRPVAVPLEAVGIEGRQLVSLDMKPPEYAAAMPWQSTDGTQLPPDATIDVALVRN